MRSRAVSFDLDATLLDNGFIPETISACCSLVARRLGVAETAVVAANAAAFSARWATAEAELAVGTLTGQAMIREVWGAALASCDCDDAALLEELLAEHVRLDERNARLYDDVLPAVATLRDAGIRLAVITNGASDTQRARLSSLGIVDWFDEVVISAEVGAVKPDPALFARAARGLDVDGRDLWHVGDTLATDVQGALAAGHTAVWLNRTGLARHPDEPVPHVELHSLAELPSAMGL